MDPKEVKIHEICYGLNYVIKNNIKSKEPIVNKNGVIEIPWIKLVNLELLVKVVKKKWLEIEKPIMEKLINKLRWWKTYGFKYHNNQFEMVIDFKKLNDRVVDHTIIIVDIYYKIENGSGSSKLSDTFKIVFDRGVIKTKQMQRKDDEPLSWKSVPKMIDYFTKEFTKSLDKTKKSYEEVERTYKEKCIEIARIKKEANEKREMELKQEKEQITVLRNTLEEYFETDPKFNVTSSFSYNELYVAFNEFKFAFTISKNKLVMYWIANDRGRDVVFNVDFHNDDMFINIIKQVNEDYIIEYLRSKTHREYLRHQHHNY